MNNFIVAFEIFSKKENFNPDELLILQVIQSRWNNFYNILINSRDDHRKNILNEIGKYIKIEEEKRMHILESDEFHKEEDFDVKIRGLLRNFKMPELWKVLEKNFETLNKINDWHIYRRATEVGIEPIDYIRREDSPIDINYDAYQLLLAEDITEFNRKRSKEFLVLNLRNTILASINLRGIDLEEANLKDASIVRTVLQDANLKNSTLSNADLDGSDLRNADLTGADLSGASLVDVTLDGLTIEGTDFSNSIIINNNIADYNSLSVNENTNFKDAIIDDLKFIDYINRFTKKVPEKILSKRILKIKLEEKGIPQNEIKNILLLSKLPE